MLMEGSLQVADFFDTGIQKIISWYDHSSLNPGSDYVEK
jgi:hypothetical protein